jgi:hypothetical protein
MVMYQMTDYAGGGSQDAPVAKPLASRYTFHHRGRCVDATIPASPHNLGTDDTHNNVSENFWIAPDFRRVGLVSPRFSQVEGRQSSGNQFRKKAGLDDICPHCAHLKYAVTIHSATCLANDIKSVFLPASQVRGTDCSLSNCAR